MICTCSTYAIRQACRLYRYGSIFSFLKSGSVCEFFHLLFIILMAFFCIIIIIIIMAEWQLLTWLATWERETHMVCNLMLPHEDDILNKFGIWNERHLQVRKPYHLPGWMKNSPYYNAPALHRFTRSVPFLGLNRVWKKNLNTTFFLSDFAHLRVKMCFKIPGMFSEKKKIGPLRFWARKCLRIGAINMLISQ